MVTGEFENVRTAGVGVGDERIQRSREQFRDIAFWEFGFDSHVFSLMLAVVLVCENFLVWAVLGTVYERETF